MSKSVPFFVIVCQKLRNNHKLCQNLYFWADMSNMKKLWKVCKTQIALDGNFKMIKCYDMQASNHCCEMIRRWGSWQSDKIVALTNWRAARVPTLNFNLNVLLNFNGREMSRLTWSIWKLVLSFPHLALEIRIIFKYITTFPFCFCRLLTRGSLFPFYPTRSEITFSLSLFEA